MLFATEQIRRMRGGAQSHLMRCSDGHHYVVKFQNNPQHRRILVNELLGTRLAARLGLPVTPVAIVHVSEELIRLTPELCMEMPRARVPCQPGPQFGSRYPGDPRRLTLHDFLPDDQPPEDRDYRAAMIDQGFCFNAGEWNYPDAPLRGLYARNRVYEGVIGMESFAPWTERVEKSVTERVLAEVIREIPPQWYEDDYDAVTKLLEQLYRRRTRVPELLLAAKNTTRQPFPNWR